MGLKLFNISFLFLVLITRSFFLLSQVEGESEATSINLSQVEGESEATSINLRKPAVFKTGTVNTAERNFKDVTPPRITIISPQIDSTSTSHISESNIYLIGRLTDETGVQSFFINDSIASTDNNGFFQRSFILDAGLNVIKIEVSDELSNTTTKYIQLINDGRKESVVNGDELEFKGDYYGLIIGIDNYSDPDLIDLDHPITDATLLYSTLIGNYMFEPENLTLLKDPTRADIIKSLDILSNQLTPNDNLILFYAGHGYWDEQKETGYWLPSDAEQFSSVNWIRNSTIQDFVDDINTRHTLLISDACFAGSIFKTRGAFQDASIAVNKLYSLSSRKAMTSGTLKEVPDKSVFIEYFLKRLHENNKKYISSGELYSSFREAVLNNSPNIPQYGVIQDAGDEGGEFIFIRRQ